MNVYEAFYAALRDLREGRLEKIFKKNTWKLAKARDHWLRHVGAPGANDRALDAGIGFAQRAVDSSSVALGLAKAKAAARVKGSAGRAARSDLTGIRKRKEIRGETSTGHRKGLNKVNRDAKTDRAGDPFMQGNTPAARARREAFRKQGHFGADNARWTAPDFLSGG